MALKKTGQLLFDSINDRGEAALSKNAELIVRRMLDLLWKSETARFPNQMGKLFNAAGKGMSLATFRRAWHEIQYDGFEVFRVTTDGKWIDAESVTLARQKAKKISNQRKRAGSIGGRKKWSKSGVKVPQETVTVVAGNKSNAEIKSDFFSQIKKFNEF